MADDTLPAQNRDFISYLLYYDDDVIPIEQSMTLGNHLDNDVVVAGEDVADYHLRLETTDRGPVVVPLGESTCNVNGVEIGQPQRVIIGDTLRVGAATMQIGVELEMRESADFEWRLVDEQGSARDIVGELSVGRADGADVVLADSHISRFHARLLERDGLVWLQDLHSANGSRVNGERINGGVRLFHGDEISFDRFNFQIAATGGDLTPIHRFENPLQGTRETLPGTGSTASQSTNEVAAAAAGPPEAKPHLAGALRLSDTTEGSHLLLDLGATRLGNVEILVNADGVRVTALSPQDRPRVNGESVDNAMLDQGDTLEVHGKRYVLQSGSTDQQRPDTAQRWLPVGIGAAVVLVVLLVILLLR